MSEQSKDFRAERTKHKVYYLIIKYTIYDKQNSMVVADKQYNDQCKRIDCPIIKI